MPYNHVFLIEDGDKELGLFDEHFERWPESHWLQPTAVKTVIYKLPGHHHATRYERANDLLHRLGGRGGAKAARATPLPACLPVVAEQRERRASAADLGARRLSSGDCAALSPRPRGRRAAGGSSSSSSVPMDDEVGEAERAGEEDHGGAGGGGGRHGLRRVRAARRGESVCVW